MERQRAPPFMAGLFGYIDCDILPLLYLCYMEGNAFSNERSITTLGAPESEFLPRDHLATPASIFISTLTAWVLPMIDFKKQKKLRYSVKDFSVS